jgi:hypothetical protein
MPIQSDPDRARADADGFFVNGFFVSLIIVGLAVALLVIAGRYSAFMPQHDRTLNQTLRLDSDR